MANTHQKRQSVLSEFDSSDEYDTEMGTESIKPDNPFSPSSSKPIMSTRHIQDEESS
ncbi:hypothetical protein HK097_005048, partial [Rhizophlyctis rosea]